MSAPVSIVWFRSDFRLGDNPAVDAAVAAGGPVVPVFIWAPQEEEEWPPGTASRWWLHHSLRAFAKELEAVGSQLVLRSGNSMGILLSLCKETGATNVFWNRRCEPACVKRDREVEEALFDAGIRPASFNGALLCEPSTITTRAGTPFKVFTAFWRACLAAQNPPAPTLAPCHLSGPRRWPASLSLEELRLVKQTSQTARLSDWWRPGTVGAWTRLDRFLKEALSAYDEARNRPDLPGTSRLSPHLHFGELSPRQVLHALQRHARESGLSEGKWLRSQFVAELGWREFAHHLLWHYPHTRNAPLRPEFEHFSWRSDRELLSAWQNGRTGYPIVDAGMRELDGTGWMHNRVRMIVASFLVKDLLISWRSGAEWFWERLVDADLANNTLGWQWTAGCGADAAPFFRIFNPVVQGMRFDPEGRYVRKWVPELARMSARWIHCPWEAPQSELSSAGINLGSDYPFPIVQHRIAREVALQAYLRMNRKGRR
ncbi:MAG: cryptochrome/photolyase family protein [Verrucomicrobiia bacterium]